MRNILLLKASLMASTALLAGSLLTTALFCQDRRQAFMEELGQTVRSAADGISQQVEASFSKSIHLSLAMSHDMFLTDLIIGANYMEGHDTLTGIQRYLRQYQERFGLDAVLLSLAGTGLCYTPDGTRPNVSQVQVIKAGYHGSLGQDLDYAMDVGSHGTILYTECEVKGRGGEVLGHLILGSGISSLKGLLKLYEEGYGVHASLIGLDGHVKLNAGEEGLYTEDWFSARRLGSIRRQVLRRQGGPPDTAVWPPIRTNGTSYVATRYIPELSWFLVVEKDVRKPSANGTPLLSRPVAAAAAIAAAMLLAVNGAIRWFGRQATRRIEERETLFKEAFKQLYDELYELDITHNCYTGSQTEDGFKPFGAKGLPYDEALRAMAKQRVNEEYQKGYVSTFSPAHVLREYELGNRHLQYDYLSAQDGGRSNWMRADAHLFESAQDRSIHMFLYVKNMDADRQKEFRAVIDEMTGFYTKAATERTIRWFLEDRPGGSFAFFIFDIDNFKQANDRFGHAFGDFCIEEFATAVQPHFGERDVLGRIGGDEFAAFLPISSAGCAEAKAKELSASLDFVCRREAAAWHISASIGVAVSPQDGTDFESLYRNADAALYRVKQSGKNGYALYSG